MVTRRVCHTDADPLGINGIESEGRQTRLGSFINQSISVPHPPIFYIAHRAVPTFAVLPVAARAKRFKPARAAAHRPLWQQGVSILTR
jgi:hypothetical protein